MEDGAGSATEFDGGEEEEEEEVEEEEEEEDEDELRGGEHEIVATEDGFEIGLASVGWRTRKLCRQLNLADPLVVTIASEGSLGLAIGVDKREGRIICQFITQAGLLKEIAPQVGRGDCVLALNDEVFPPFQFFDVDGDGAVVRPARSLFPGMHLMVPAPCRRSRSRVHCLHLHLYHPLRT